VARALLASALFAWPFEQALKKKIGQIAARTQQALKQIIRIGLRSTKHVNSPADFVFFTPQDGNTRLLGSKRPTIAREASARKFKYYKPICGLGFYDVPATPPRFGHGGHFMQHDMLDLCCGSTNFAVILTKSFVASFHSTGSFRWKTWHILLLLSIFFPPQTRKFAG
jgi:hypothetical protein